MLAIVPGPRWVGEQLKSGEVAGVIASGVLDLSTARAFRRDTRGLPLGAILAADEEGGLVQRYAAVAGVIPSAQDQSATMSTDEVHDLYLEHGRKLRRLGVDMGLAPVVDVGTGAGIGSRSYGADPDVVARYAAAAAAGYRDAGILPVLKHFPGHGRVSQDSHQGLAIGPSLSEVRRVDLVPYEQLLSEPRTGVLVGHVQTPGLDSGPATFSRAAITGLLREELGFRGIVVSDALGMAGGSQAGSSPGEWNQGTALVAFIRAGGDLGIVGPGGSREGMREMLSAAREGELKRSQINRVALRVLRLKGVDPCSVDESALGSSAGGADEPMDEPVVNPTAVGSKSR